MKKEILKKIGFAVAAFSGALGITAIGIKIYEYISERDVPSGTSKTKADVVVVPSVKDIIINGDDETDATISSRVENSGILP